MWNHFLRRSWGSDFCLVVPFIVGLVVSCFNFCTDMIVADVDIFWHFRACESCRASRRLQSDQRGDGHAHWPYLTRHASEYPVRTQGNVIARAVHIDCIGTDLFLFCLRVLSAALSVARPGRVLQDVVTQVHDVTQWRCASHS